MDINLHATQLELFHAIFDKSCDAVVVVDMKGEARYWSESAATMFGWKLSDLKGKLIDEVLIPPDGRVKADSIFGGAANQSDSSYVGKVMEVQMLHASGRTFWADLSLTDITVENEKWILAIVRDAESRKAREQELLRAATTDGLSGLANRSGFQSALESSLSGPILLAIIDVDHFKTINDEYGHPVGDQAIVFLANVLSDFFTNSNCVARLGGDEFGVVLSSEDGFDVTQVQQQFDSFLLSLADQRFSSHDLQLSVSIGVAISDAQSSARSLLTNADAALYRSKNAGRKCVTVVQDKSS